MSGSGGADIYRGRSIISGRCVLAVVPAVASDFLVIGLCSQELSALGLGQRDEPTYR